MFSIFLISVGVTSYILAFFDPNFARSRKYFQNVFPLFVQISEMIQENVYTPKSSSLIYYRY